MSTARVIALLEERGIETPEGLVKAPKGLLKRPTLDRFMRQAGYDHRRIVQPRAAVRFQARCSNELWQFDMSPSDLKEVKAPLWHEEGRGKPTLMLFSVVDDRSGVTYQEYRCVCGEDAESALRFLFNAMAPKPEVEFAFQGIPATLYLDNGPVTRSRVFQSVMTSLGVRVLPHMPASADNRRTTARSKGKVERPFRTVKEAFETLFHFREPENEAEANLWFRRYLISYKAFTADKTKVTLTTLITALFHDLTPGKDVQIPRQSDERERALCELVRKQRKPVAIFVDEAQKLHHKTLTGLKHLMEVVAESNRTLSVVLIGKPKLRNDLRRPTMAEIGYRTTILELQSMAGCQGDYIRWMLVACSQEGTDPAELMTEEAIDLIATRLRTPLQIERYLAAAFDEAYRLGVKPVSADIVDAVLSRQIDDLEPVLMEHGYDIPTLTAAFNCKPAEVRDLLAGNLEPDRAQELTAQMRAAGLPI